MFVDIFCCDYVTFRQLMNASDMGIYSIAIFVFKKLLVIIKRYYTINHIKMHLHYNQFNFRSFMMTINRAFGQMKQFYASA